MATQATTFVSKNKKKIIIFRVETLDGANIEVLPNKLTLYQVNLSQTKFSYLYQITEFLFCNLASVLVGV